MNKTERQALAKVMQIGGECLVIPDASYVLSDIGDEASDMDALIDLMRLLRVLMQYQQFDLEATRRERNQLQHMIDGSGGNKNER